VEWRRKEKDGAGRGLVRSEAGEQHGRHGWTLALVNCSLNRTPCPSNGHIYIYIMDMYIEI